jgi:hypothetical protein
MASAIIPHVSDVMTVWRVGYVALAGYTVLLVTNPMYSHSPITNKDDAVQNKSCPKFLFGVNLKMHREHTSIVSKNIFQRCDHSFYTGQITFEVVEKDLGVYWGGESF